MVYRLPKDWFIKHPKFTFSNCGNETTSTNIPYDSRPDMIEHYVKHAPHIGINRPKGWENVLQSMSTFFTRKCIQSSACVWYFATFFHFILPTKNLIDENWEFDVSKPLELRCSYVWCEFLLLRWFCNSKTLLCWKYMCPLHSTRQHFNGDNSIFFCRR